MINFWAERDQRNCFTIKGPLAFFVNLFKRKKYKVRKHHVKGNLHCGIHPKVPTNLSVSAMDMRMSSPCPISPTLSTLTLTPGRMRDIDQDMEALRLSRQDNPFLQVLASRESLVESTFESVSDDTNLMSQEFPNELEVDPLSLPEIHEHMIRSPPPTTWPKSPNFKVFRFPIADSDENLQINNSQCGSSKKSLNSIRDEEETISKFYKSKELVDSYGINYSTISSPHSLQTQADVPHKRSNSGSRGEVSLESEAKFLENLARRRPIFNRESEQPVSNVQDNANEISVGHTTSSVAREPRGSQRIREPRAKVRRRSSSHSASSVEKVFVIVRYSGIA